jgi:hypothetical protein
VLPKSTEASHERYSETKILGYEEYDIDGLFYKEQDDTPE